MKKILVYFCFFCMPYAVLSATMCAKNDTMVLALDPAVAPSTYSYSGSTWQAPLASGIFRGVSACTTYNGGSMGNYLISGNPITATRGEASGQYCWCMLTHPVSSRWVFSNDRGSASNCASACSITAVTTSGAAIRCGAGCLVRLRNDVCEGPWPEIARHDNAPIV